MISTHTTIANTTKAHIIPAMCNMVSLIQTPPDWHFCNMVCMRVSLFVNRYNAEGAGSDCILKMTSSMVLNVMIGNSGPNISSCMMVSENETLSNNVGAIFKLFLSVCPPYIT